MITLFMKMFLFFMKKFEFTAPFCELGYQL